jgi:regulator of replication initiation timing
MANYIKTLQEENKTLKEENEKLKQTPIEPEKVELTPEEDGRQEMIEIAYGYDTGPNIEHCTLQEGFDKLVNYYSGMNKSTDRNVLREYRLSTKHPYVTCNRTPCFVKKFYKDFASGQEVSLTRDTFLWLAVDDAVQKNQNVQLIPKKEYMDFYHEIAKEDIRHSARYQAELEKQKIVRELQKELPTYKPEEKDAIK